MRRLFVFILIFLIGTTLLGLLSYTFLSSPVDITSTKKIEIRITKGESADQIADVLSSSHLIRSRKLFRIYIRLTGIYPRIQAGYFYFSPSQPLAEISRGLTKASVKATRITIPEGLRREEIANIIIDTLQKNKTPHRFDPDEFIRKTTNLEGHLFPDTYDLPENVTTDQMITMLTNQFTNQMQDLNVSPGDLDRIVILASLIEREAGSDSERPEIAGVFINRLQGHWPLQVDATIQYALASSHCRLRICDWWPRPLSKDDLALKSLYNTYLNQGLPPSPICNPGLTSLKAAASPAVTANWFYLHDSTGQIHFAKTVAEHNKNVCNYLKKDC